MKSNFRYLLPALFLLLPGIANAAPAAQPYWLCADTQGTRIAQDHPCDPADPSKNRHEARPVVVPSDRHGAAAAGGLADLPSEARQIAGHVPPVTPTMVEAIGVLGALALVMLALIVIRGLASRRQGSASDKNRDKVPNPAGRGRSLFGPKVWDLALIQSLGAGRLEELCQALWTAEGHRAVWSEPRRPGSGRVLCVDVGEGGKPAAIVQISSGASEPAGINQVRELYGNLGEFGARQAIWVAAAEFTADAKLFAGGKPVALVDGAALVERLQGLPQALRQALLKQVGRRGYRK